MTRFHICCVAFGTALAACGIVETPIETSSTEQAGMNLQGMNLQGMNLQGMNLQGMSLGGATLSGDTLDHVRVERGEVVAERGGTTLRGTSLVGAHFFGVGRNLTATPPTSATIEYRIAAVSTEDARYDPTHTGNTFLYTLEQYVADSGSWQPACQADTDGRRVAIPLAAVWDEHGDRSQNGSLFTFGCTTGVIAKCYRWGYRPWVTGYGDLVKMHWTCTRVARADYCGDGTTHTHDGTTINVWDKLPAPGPIQRHDDLSLPLGLPPLGLPPLGMIFEAGWNTGGAVCLSRARWLLDDGALLAALCPDRLVPPGLGGVVCNTVSEAVSYDQSAVMFNEAYLNL